MKFYNDFTSKKGILFFGAVTFLVFIFAESSAFAARKAATKKAAVKKEQSKPQERTTAATLDTSRQLSKENISSNIWNIGQNFMNKNSKKKLKENNLVKIKILNKRINKNDFQIKCIGKLLDFASDEEINKYYGLIENDEEKNILEKTNDSDIDDLSEKMNNFII